jgi:hypothetical protein
MRLLFAMLALSVAAAAAKADEARLVPAAGSTLTYKLVATTKSHDKTITTGQIYSYIVASSDGATAEGTIKPLALLFDCREGALDAECARAKKTPNVREENGLTVVPIPPEIGDQLAAKSAFKLRAFIVELRKFPAPLPADPKAPSDSLVSADDPLVVTSSMQCDAAALLAFTPIGKSPETTLACQTTFERSGWSASGVKPITMSDSVSLEVSYLGEGRITLPSGEWDVRNLTMKQMSSRESRPGAVVETQFSDKLGAAVKTHVVVDPLKGAIATETESELIAVSP